MQYLDQQSDQDPGFLEGSAAARVGWERFPGSTCYQYPLRAASGHIRTRHSSTPCASARMTPNSVSAAGPPREKLSGDQLSNFGGFFKRSWRCNDLLWGRLDGLARIFETLLTREAVAAAMKDPAGTAERLSVIASLNLPPVLTAWLNDLADPGRSRATRRPWTRSIRSRRHEGAAVWTSLCVTPSPAGGAEGCAR